MEDCQVDTNLGARNESRTGYVNDEAGKAGKESEHLMNPVVQNLTCGSLCGILIDCKLFLNSWPSARCSIGTNFLPIVPARIPLIALSLTFSSP